MMLEYPKYGRGELKTVFEKLPGKEKAELREYTDYCRMNAGQRKVDDMVRSVLQFRDICGKPCTDLKTLRDFLTLLNKSDREKWTKNGIKIHIKHYLKWKFKDWSERFDNFKDVKVTNGFNNKKINEGTLVNQKDVERMIRKEQSLYWKTFFICLYESGLRPCELTNLKWNDVTFNVEGEITELHIFATKTDRARAVYVKGATKYLQRLREESESDLVFPAPSDKNKPVNKTAINMHLARISEKVLGRKIFPYLLRHSRASELYKNMPSKVAQKFMGHGRDMSDFYAHFSSADVKEAVAKTVYNYEDGIPVEKKHALELKIENHEQTIADMSKKMELVLQTLQRLENEKSHRKVH